MLPKDILHYELLGKFRSVSVNSSGNWCFNFFGVGPGARVFKQKTGTKSEFKICDQARSHGGHSWAVPLPIIFVPPHILLCPGKFVLNIYQKQKYFPSKMYFALPNLKSWLRACMWLRSSLHHTTQCTHFEWSRKKLFRISHPSIFTNIRTLASV